MNYLGSHYCGEHRNDPSNFPLETGESTVFGSTDSTTMNYFQTDGIVYVGILVILDVNGSKFNL
jgi:hypothetical protein